MVNPPEFSLIFSIFYVFKIVIVKGEFDKQRETKSNVFIAKVVKLSSEYQILSKSTAFVGVIKNKSGEIQNMDAPVKVEQGPMAPEGYYDGIQTLQNQAAALCDYHEYR